MRRSAFSISWLIGILAIVSGYDTRADPVTQPSTQPNTQPSTTQSSTQPVGPDPELVARAIRRIDYVQDAEVVKLGEAALQKFLDDNVDLSKNTDLRDALLNVITTGRNDEIQTPAAKQLGQSGHVNDASSMLIRILTSAGPILAQTAISSYAKTFKKAPSVEIMNSLKDHRLFDTIHDVGKFSADPEVIRYLIQISHSENKIALVYDLDLLEAADLAYHDFQTKVDTYTNHNNQPPQEFLDLVPQLRLYIEGRPYQNSIQALVTMVKTSGSEEGALQAAMHLAQTFDKAAFDGDPAVTSLGLHAILETTLRADRALTDFDIKPPEREHYHAALKAQSDVLQKTFFPPPPPPPAQAPVSVHS